MLDHRATRKRVLALSVMPARACLRGIAPLRDVNVSVVDGLAKSLYTTFLTIRSYRESMYPIAGNKFGASSHSLPALIAFA